MLRFLFALIVAAGSSAADPIPAAGRIESAHTEGTCSAVLVGPDLILTAAHCVGSGPDGVVFRPGIGPQGDTYPLAATAFHPMYDRDNTRPHWKVRFDIGIARLDDGLPPDVASPLTIGRPAEVGERLFIVSWRGRGGAFPRQRACPVLDGAPGIVTLGCQVIGGESGAPVLRAGASGLELVAIISSRSMLGRQHVGLATDVDLRFQPLLDALD